MDEPRCRAAQRVLQRWIQDSRALTGAERIAELQQRGHVQLHLRSPWRRDEWLGDRAGRRDTGPHRASADRSAPSTTDAGSDAGAHDGAHAGPDRAANARANARSIHPGANADRYRVSDARTGERGHGAGHRGRGPSDAGTRAQRRPGRRAARRRGDRGHRYRCGRLAHRASDLTPSYLQESPRIRKASASWPSGIVTWNRTSRLAWRRWSRSRWLANRWSRTPREPQRSP